MKERRPRRHIAVSGTAKGEHFIRLAVGHGIASRMRYLGETLGEACGR